ncbi:MULTISPECIES: hypothetical protein [unclassified Psychrobacillus]|uniref:hypothetical protein n=1 Tax=unclassified Psychrobacillus TaxID=2636677 RepID=UPI0030F669F7
MGKNGYGGTEVYVTKLDDGTTFEVVNGFWKATLCKKNGFPRLIMEGGTIQTVEEDYIANIVSECPIPIEAIVYPSVAAVLQFSYSQKPLEKVLHMLSHELIDENKRRKVLEILGQGKKDMERLIEIISGLPDEEGR